VIIIQLQCKNYLHFGGKDMYINQIFELYMVLDHEKFHKILNRAHKKADYLEEGEGEYIDKSFVSKGLTVKYRDSQYRKKVKLIINAGMVVDGDKCDPDKFIRKLVKMIGEYFEYKYQVDDFALSGVFLAADIDVHNRENVAAYMKVLQRIGKVKGFSPSDYECLDGVDSFCLDGNSNGIAFLLYDLEGMCRKRFEDNDTDRKKLKAIIKESEGIIRTELRLTKPKAIRDYTEANDISGQIMDVLERRQDIFLETFVRIVPFGNFYKKDKAVELIRSRVEDARLRRKMLRLVALIPEKKSLYLAQKAMNCRNMEKIMEEFAKVNVSPVTISKRQDIKWLRNIYDYLLNYG